MSNDILKAKLDAFILHRANAARIAKERGGKFTYAPGHPHDLLDATDSAVREYFYEVNASITALHEAGVASGDEKDTEKPELLEPHVCECCKKLVIPVPPDIKRGQPIGSIWKPSPSFGPIGPRRREALYASEADDPPRKRWP